MPELHALLSASDADRWLNCPPAVRLTEGLRDDDEDSDFSAEGTLAHSLAELRLRKAYGQKADKSELLRIKSSKYYNQAMWDAVTEFVNEVHLAVGQAAEHIELNRAQGRTVPDDAEVRIWFELQVNTSRYVPEGFGTSDVVIVADNLIHVIDLKFGKGKLVSVQDNPQLKLYALGVPDTIKQAVQWSHCKLTIVQPRLHNTETTELSYIALERWAKEVVRPKALLAYTGKGEMAAGKWCQWCPIKDRCTTRAAHLLEPVSFAEPDWLQGEELASILERSSDIKSWLTLVDSYAVQLALQGEKIPRFKLVEGKAGRRAIEDEAGATAELTLAGYSEEDFMKPQQIRGITDLEKLLGAKAFNELLSDYIKPPATGSPKLAPETDRRPEWQPFSTDDFDTI